MTTTAACLRPGHDEPAPRARAPRRGRGARGAGRLQHGTGTDGDRLLLVDDVERYASSAEQLVDDVLERPAPHRSAGRDGRAVPRRRLQRGQRPRRLRHRALRHPVQLRLVDDDRGRRAADHQAHRPRHLDGAAKTGAAVYLWHCDREGQYSLYSRAVTAENYLRGVQETDSTGTVTFTSIFPACYSGRWPHIHFEVYSSVADATSSGPIVKTSQIALPKETCDAVYATDGYS